MTTPPPASRGGRLTLLLASTLTILAAAIVAPTLPALRDDFADVSRVDLLSRLVLTTPALFIVLGAPLAGWLADRYGRKPLLLGATLCYAAAGSAPAWLPGLQAILASRALLGLAVAGTMTAATTLLADAAKGPARRRLLGEQSAFIGLGGSLFLAAGGLLSELAWRTAFLLYLVALLLLWPMQRTLRETMRPRGPAARRASLPLQRLVGPWGMAFAAQVIFYLSPVHLPFLLRKLGVPGSTWTGISLALLTLCYAIGGGLLAAPAALRFPRRRVFALAFAAVGASYVWIGLQETWLRVLPGLAVAGLGLGLLIPNLFAQAADAAEAQVRGRAMGTVTTFLFLGQFLAPIVSAPLASALGLGAVFSIAGAFGLLVGVGLAALPALPVLRRA
ncbi:MFS transporter [Vulgatibacter sp.]|uniref:MFS transporter n=1 Tax=Vulgatibacter sp. TaxID=1971226 RepID=UPI0035617780